MANLLEFRNVTKTYTRGFFSEAGTTALADFSMTLKEEDPTILTVAGESGSGKTTLAMLLLGFIDPTQGQILYKGEDIRNLRGDARMTFRREVQAVFQDPFAVFNPFYTVDHLLTVPIEKFKLAKSKAEARSKMEEALSAVGLRPEDILGRFPHQLSGGQRQRVGIAIALCGTPSLLIADEPTSALDVTVQREILELLSEITDETKTSLIFISHDLAVVNEMTNRVLVMQRGSLVEDGETKSVFSDPRHEYTRRLVSSAKRSSMALQHLTGETA